MTIATIAVGHVEVTALLDGLADLSDMPIVAAFPDAPPDALLAQKAAHPGVYGEGDSWRLHVRAWLVRHPARDLLVDTGVGSTLSMSWYPEPGWLHEALAEAGTAADLIDTVVITHVHDDHVGGTVTSDGEPAFRNARHVIQHADLEMMRSATADDEEALAIWQTLLAPLDDADMFEVIDGDVPLADGIWLHHAPGHTPGHQVVRIESEDRRLLISGDTWNHPAQFANPDWSSAPDADPTGAAATRRALLSGLLSHPGTIVAPTHFAEAFGHVVSDPAGLAVWDPLPV
jgi:glyoxylase-like metal-dependent hydrolase (beta-lactamase superfamily II)